MRNKAEYVWLAVVVVGVASLMWLGASRSPSTPLPASPSASAARTAEEGQAAGRGRPSLSFEQTTFEYDGSRRLYRFTMVGDANGAACEAMLACNGQTRSERSRMTVAERDDLMAEMREHGVWKLVNTRSLLAGVTSSRVSVTEGARSLTVTLGPDDDQVSRSFLRLMSECQVGSMEARLSASMASR